MLHGLSDATGTVWRSDAISRCQVLGRADSVHRGETSRCCMVCLMPQAQCGEVMPLAVVRSWVEQTVFIMGQTSRCCMVCLMPQSQCGEVMLLAVVSSWVEQTVFIMGRPVGVAWSA